MACSTVVEPYKHSYPHCYRCGTPLFYNALPAWFVNIQKIKPELLKNNQDISWYPEHLKNGRFKQGVETRRIGIFRATVFGLRLCRFGSVMRPDAVMWFALVYRRVGGKID